MNKIFLNKTLRLCIIFGSVLLFALISWSAMESRKLVSNRVSDWMPQGTPEIRDFTEHFYPHFPEGELLMISWKGATMDDERLDTVAETLQKAVDAGRTGIKPSIPSKYFKSIITSRSLRSELKDMPGMNSKSINRRMQGWLIGKNGKDACMIAVIDSEADRKETVRLAFKTVEKITGLEQSDIHIAGPTIDSVAIDETAAHSQQILLPVFLVFCFALLLLCLRQMYVACIVFFVAAANEELGGALLYWTGAHVDSVSMLISSLTYVLTISGGIHLVNYYRETIHSFAGKTAPFAAYRKAVLPCTLAAVTTVFGLGSLAISRMIPIRTFGIYASLALILGTVWLFLFVLSCLQQRSVYRWRIKALENPEGTFHHRLQLFWGTMGSEVFRFRRLLVWVSFILMIFFAYECKNLKTTVTFHGMMPPSNKVIQDYHFLENTFGGLIPVEIMLEIPDRGGLQVPVIEQLNIVAKVKETLEEMNTASTVVSILNFIPGIPQENELGLSATARRSALTSMMQRSPERLMETHFYDRSDAEEKSFWRLSLRTYAQIPIDYGQLLAEIKERIRKAVGEQPAEMLNSYVTGGVPLAHRAQQQLLTDLIYSFLSAFILIALSMMILLRGIVRGLIAMVPNIFPCILVFGGMAWLGLPVDIGSMMTASVAMGISVDGTLHFLTWFQHGLKSGTGGYPDVRKAAVVGAYRHCATALVQTTIICGGGMLVFALSGFIPVARFAVLLFLLLTASLIGDIVVFPAILFTRLGKIYGQ